MESSTPASRSIQMLKLQWKPPPRLEWLFFSEKLALTSRRLTSNRLPEESAERSDSQVRTLDSTLISATLSSTCTLRMPTSPLLFTSRRTSSTWVLVIRDLCSVMQPTNGTLKLFIHTLTCLQIRFARSWQSKERTVRSHG